MSEELCILNVGVQTVAPQLAAPQVVYLDFDGAATSYVNADLGVAIDNVTVDDSGISESDIAVIVDALNGMFDDVVFSSALPADGEFSTIYIGVTSAFEEYGAFLGLAETIDSGNQIRDDNAFVLLDSSTSTELVVSVIAHETEHIVHGMEHGGDGLERFADINVVGGGLPSVSAVISNDRMNVYTAGMAISTTVNRGGMVNVYNNGLANYTTVNYGGLMEVYSSGIANVTTVNSGGSMLVYSSGIANVTTVNQGGDMGVYSHGQANNTTMNDGWMFVYSGGIATSTTMNDGWMFVYSGGTAGVTTMNDGLMGVYSGGTATSTTVNGGGRMNVSNGGIAVSTTVYYGQMNINDGGTATSTTVNGGMNVYDNGTATSTTVNVGGSMFVYSGGTANSTFMNGGRMWVDTSGAANITSVSGGIMCVFSGGTANSTTLNGTYMLVSSGVFATSTIVSSGAMYVSQGGIANNTTLNGGEMAVSSGGTANITTVNGGRMAVSSGGTANITTVSIGSMFVRDGGTATCTTVNGGSMNVSSGGVANITTMNGGEMNVFSGGKVTGGLTIAEGARVLVNDGGVIDFDIFSLSPGNAPLVNKLSLVQGTPSYTLTVADKQANGTYILAGGADGFGNNITVANTDTLTVGEAKVIGTATYTLALNGGELALSVGNVLFTDDVTDEKEMTYNMLASGVHVKEGGCLNVESGGTAGSTTICDGGVMNVSSGGTADSTTICDGGVMHGSNGGTADSTTICDGGVMIVFSGGTADSTTICDGGVMEVFSGGTVGGLSIADGAVVSAHDGGVIEFDLQGVSPNNAPFVHGISLIEGKPSMIVKVASFNKHGDYYLADGAEGFDMPIIINGGTSKLGPDDVILSGTVCYTLSEDSGKLKFGLLQKQTVASSISATYNVSLGSCLCSATVLSRFRQAAPQLSVLSGGMTFSTSINSNCTMNVQRGASAHTTTVRSGGSMIVNGARIVSTTVLNNGNINLYDGTAKATTVTSGGRMFVSNVKLTGTLTIADGGTVTAANGSTIDFDISALTPGNAPIVNNLSLIKGNPSYAVTVKAKQALGDYSLAGGAANFNGTLTVKCAGAEDITLTVGDARVPIGDKGYSLAVMDGKLLLSIIDITPPAAPELTLSGDSASRELIVTAAWDTDDAVCLYAVDGSEELTEYDSPLRFSDDASVRFQTKDAADNTTDRSLDLMFGRATGKWTEGYRAWNPDGYDKTVELKGRNVIGGVFDGSDDSTILVLTDDDNGDALFMDDIYSAYPNGKAAQSRISKVNEIIAGAGDDIVDLTSPRFDYADGCVTVHGGLGDDVIWANGGSNRLFGDAGDDRIVGADGNDVLVGGVGNDVMHGGGGDDIFCFCGGWGNDAVEQLATGKVTLWFADGDESKWDAETLTYTDGENSVTVAGVADVTLLFGKADERYDGLLAAGAFDAFSSERIFENRDTAILIVE